MTLIQKLGLTEVPDEEQSYVDIFRGRIKDDETLNILLETKENTDIELYRSLILTLMEINEEFLPRTTYNAISEFPAWNALILGATLQVLIMNGILSARNTLTYRDAGGITVDNMDVYGRYVNFFNILTNRYMRAVQTFKVNYNVDQCYGGVHSQYNDLDGS